MCFVCYFPLCVCLVCFVYWYVCMSVLCFDIFDGEAVDSLAILGLLPVSIAYAIIRGECLTCILSPLLLARRSLTGR